MYIYIYIFLFFFSDIKFTKVTFIRLKRYYEESSTDGVLQTDIWYAYRDQFMNSPVPMMPAAEVIKNVNVAFSDSSAIMTTTVDGASKYPFFFHLF
jgi:hypothetical protein